MKPYYADESVQRPKSAREVIARRLSQGVLDFGGEAS